MSVHERTDIERKGTEWVTGIERSDVGSVVYGRGGTGSQRRPSTRPTILSSMQRLRSDIAPSPDVILRDRVK